MTRDEANRKAQKAWVEGTSADAGPSMVNVFVALGMLKLDEPKTREQLIAKACSIGGIKARDWNKVEHGLSLAGLKIVEK